MFIGVKININGAAQITINNKTIYLGRYDTIEEAIKAREESAKKYYKEYNYDIEKDSKYNFRNNQ